MIQIVGTQLSQWDTGRIVSVSNSNATKIHFANQGDSKAPIIDIIDGEAKIPDYLLQTGKTLFAYAVLDGVTLESKSFSVSKRAKPDNYVYEEDQRNYIYELIQSAEVATEAATQAAQNATTATENANEAAENANYNATAALVCASRADKAANNANTAATKATQTAKSLMVVGKTQGANITLDDAIEMSLVGLRVFGKTTQDGTPTPDAPVDLVSAGNSGSITVNVTGKNLWDHSNDIADLASLSGWGTDIWRNLAVIRTMKPKTTYTMKCKVTCLSVPNYASVYSDQCGFVLYTNQNSGNNTLMALDMGKGVLVSGEQRILKGTFTTPEDVSDTSKNYRILYYTQRLLQEDGKAVYANIRVDDVQLEEGGIATEYEPHKKQMLITSTPNSLPGVPVASGGNYTDANGQQWICDEIDFARGVYVRRIGVIESYNGEEITNAYMSTTGELTTGAKVIYVLDKPVETPLSEEELAAYASLHTYRGNTTVTNDAGAWMELEYVMDAKKYIDSLFAGGIVPATVE